MCKVLCWTKSFELKLDLSINSWSDEISRHFKMTMSIERYQANSVLLLRHKTIEFFFFLLHSSNNNKPHFGHNAFDGHVTKAFHFRMDFRLAKMCYSIQLELSFKLIKIVVKLLNFIWRLCSISFCLATYLPTYLPAVILATVQQNRRDKKLSAFSFSFSPSCNCRFDPMLKTLPHCSVRSRAECMQ